MAKCKACGLDFASTNPTDEICYVCERALKRLNGYAVPVVRCKDCKYWSCYGGEDEHKGDCLELTGLDSCMYEEDFCSYGERRKENG